MGLFDDSTTIARRIEATPHAAETCRTSMIHMRQSEDIPAMPFPSLARQTKRLAITPDGAFLFHSKNTGKETAIWDVKRHRLVHKLPGELIGLAKNGGTFLTRCVDKAYWRVDAAAIWNEPIRRELETHREPLCTFHAWDTLGGRELNRSRVPPETYALHQRVSISANRYKTALKISDLLGAGGSQIMALRLTDAGLETWAMAPDDMQIAVNYYVACGFEADFGVCIDIQDWSGFKFDPALSPTDSTMAWLYFSAPHNLLISGSAIYELDTGRKLCQIRRYDNPPYRVHQASVVAVNPVDRWQVAMSYNVEPPVSSAALEWHEDAEAHKQYIAWLSEHQKQYVHSVVIARIAEDSQEAQVNHVLKQKSAIEDIEFFPDGKSIAVLLQSGKIQILDTATGKTLGNLA